MYVMKLVLCSGQWPTHATDPGLECCAVSGALAQFQLFKVLLDGLLQERCCG